MRLGKSMKCILLTTALALAVFSYGCSSGRARLESNILREIKSKCHDTDVTCQIHLDVVDWVEWDTMTVFWPGMDNLEVNRILGENVLITSGPPMSIVMVLRLNGKVVYFEDDRRKIEGYNDGDVDFKDISPSKRFSVYPRSAKMDVERLSENGGKYYLLKCVNNCEIQ